MRRQAGLTIGLAAVAILATALGAWSWLRSPEALPTAKFRIALSDRPIPAGLVGRNLALSPDGGTIVFSDTMDGQRQLWIKVGDRPDAEPLTGTANGVAPAFSPDGEWIAFVADGRLRKVPRGGGSAVTIADSANGFATVAWLENGTIAFNDVGWALRVVGQDGGAARRWTWVDSVGMGVVSVTGLPGGGAALVGLCNWGCPNSALAVLDLDRGVAHRLSDDVYKAWSLRDGHVVFGRPDGGVFVGPFDPSKLNFTSAPLPVLDGVRTSAAAVDMAVSPNGTLLFVPGEVQGAAWEAVWVTRDGTAMPVDSSWSFVPTGSGGIAISPNGRRLALSIAASNSDDIWVKQLDRGPFTRLTFEGANVRPTWSADGEFILYSSRPENGTSDARRRRADGSGSAEVLLDATEPVEEVLPVPGTERMIVRLGSLPAGGVFLAERGAGDSGLSPLLVNPAYAEVSLALSPDGRWLAYASTESGRYEVYVRPFPDVDAGRWQVSRDGGNEPLWAHSGRELFYRSANGDLVAVTVHAGTSFETGEQRVLFSTSVYWSNPGHAQYDLTPDDRRFVFIRAKGSQDPGAQSSTAVLVLNWLNELKAGAPGVR